MPHSINEAEILIDNLLSYYNVSTYSDLALKIDTTQANISSWKIRNSINAIKNKCKELGIYNEIFGDLNLNKFYQTGANSQQIDTQNNDGPGMVNYTNESKAQVDNNSLNIDNELIPLFQALSSVASALDKKAQLKIELTKLISDLPKL